MSTPLLNTRITKIKPSATLAVKAAANARKAAEKDVFDLSTGEPDFDTPESVKEAAFKAIRSGKTKYTEVGGIPELRSALAEKLTNENGIPTAVDSVIVTNGGKQAIYEAFDVTLEPGDEVIVPAPFWVSYPPMVEMCSGVPVIVNCSEESDYKITPEQLRAALTPKTRMVILNSPSNPTGMAYTEQEFQALGEVLKGSEALIMSDEVYEKVLFSGSRLISFAKAVPELAARTITINAFSKSYSMTGWRVGFATGPKEIIQAMIKHQSQTTSNVKTAGQYAGVAALKEPAEFFTKMAEAFERRVLMAMDIIATSPYLSVRKRPDGAFYLFVRIDKVIQAGTISGSTQFAGRLMEETGVAAVPGVEFGDDGAIRLAVATSEQIIQEACQRLCQFTAGLMER